MCGGNAVGFGFVVTSTSKKDDCASETLKKEHSPHPGYWRAGLGAISWRGREDKNAKFSTYATKCIKNKIISSVHRNALLSGGEEADLEAILGGGGTVPEEVVVEREELNELYDKITSALSEQEWQVFQSFLRGMSYNQIALGLGTSEKAVDNAMQRVRRKLRSLLR